MSEKWQYIGEELGVGQYSLWDISTNYFDPGDSLREVLREQLRNCATTWGDITVHVDYIESKTTLHGNTCQG